MLNMRELSMFQKVRSLLSREQKRQFIILAGLVLVGMLFEMASLGLMLPTIGFMLKENVGQRYPFLQPYLEALGSPTQTQLVVGCMIFLVFFFLLKSIFMLGLSWKQLRFSNQFSVDLSQSLFLGYLRQPYAFHLQRNSAQLIRNIQGEAGQLGSVVQSSISFGIELAMMIGIALMLLAVEPIGAIAVTSLLGLSAVAFQRLTRGKLLDWGVRRQFHSGLVTQHLQQGLGGVKDVKLMGREEYFIGKYSEHSAWLAVITARFQTLGALPRLYLEFLAIVGLAGLVIAMVLQGKSLALLIATLGVFVAAAFRMIPSINRLMSSVQSIRYAQPVVDMLYNEFSLIKNTKPDTYLGNRLNFNNEIMISDVNFRYPSVSKNALKNVSIVIKKGESVGFAGRSGSGKTTLVDVILGLLPPAAGEVLVDGVDIQKNLRGWQDQIGYVPQSIYLTDDTLRANVAFGLKKEDINEQAVLQSIKAAQLDEFVAGLPEGLNTLVGERGIRLSGGQRQRIGIARALYHQPEVLVLDEATSALDTETEQGVMASIKALQGHKTILIVAHRLSTIEHCDRVYRLEHGKVVNENSNTHELRC